MTGRRRSRDGPGGRERPDSAGRPAGLRGQSEVLGVVLLLAITVMGTGLIVAYGSSALSDSKQASEVDSAEHAMTQFDSKASLVGLGASSAQTLSLGVDGTTTVRETEGWMRIRVTNQTDGTIEHRVMNRTMGTVVYRNGDARVAYQGGGVWKRTGGGTTMVSPPEFHYRGTTLTLPLVAVNGSDSLDGSVRLTPNGTTDSKFPRPGNDDLKNPLTEGEVNVTVESDYYEAWGRFFEERTGGNVSYDHGHDRVTITLVVPGETRNVTNALAGTTPDQMTVEGAGGSSFTDSYNSSDGAYSESDRAENGTILTKGGVTLTGGAEVYGDLQTGGGTVDIGGGVTVHGNISYGGTVDCKGGGGDCKSVGGWVADNGTAPDLTPVGDAVREKVQRHSDPSNNRNDEVSAIDETTDTWNDSETTLTLTAGSYYIAEETLDSTQSLVFDTSGGDVVLAVDDDVVWNDVTVEVTHPDQGEVRLYTTGTTFRVEDSAVGDVTTHQSPSLRVYAGPGLDVALDDHTEFVGLVYAPGSESVSGSVTVRTQSQLYGGVVGGGNTLLKSGGSIHFDEALEAVNPQTDVGENLPQLTYLHVSVSRVNVTNV